jgi:predicted transcriptional regulator of viral defense system
MNATEALRRLRALGVSVVTTTDAAVALGLPVDATSHTLRRLGAAGHVLAVRRGLWAVGPAPDPLSLGEHLTAPFPAYVSLQSALYLRGMIHQIPEVTYLVSLGRSRRLTTAVGTFSVHHVPPELFGGFDYLPDAGLKLARAEKALVDLCYLSGTRCRRFRALPELTLPLGFGLAAARRWLRQVPSPRLRTLAARRFAAVVARCRAGPSRSPP